jgi:hypothetical protein
MAGNLVVGSINSGTTLTTGNVIALDDGNSSLGGRMFVYVDTNGTKWAVHEFRDDGMLYLPSSKICDILIVGGGGSGGPDYGNQDTGHGGGGAGAALWRQAHTLTSGGYDIKVGIGGARASHGSTDSNDQYMMSQNGGDSWAFGVIARGGGHGGGSDNQCKPQTGGCGGGGGTRNPESSWNNGQGSRQESYSGWTAYTSSGGNGADGNASGGGGGGIGGNGGNQNGNIGNSVAQAGAGGAGRDFSSYFGTSVGHFGWFGGGGGGGTYRTGTNTMYNAPPNGGAGNYGGGGFGNSAREGSETSPNVFSYYKVDGMNGTGGGGGGAVEDHDERLANAGSSHGAGGSGAVVVRYAL